MITDIDFLWSNFLEHNNIYIIKSFYDIFYKKKLNTYKKFKSL